MLKKTFLAAAVASVFAGPAMADIDLDYNGFSSPSEDVNTTVLAAVTKQPVLSFSTAEEQVAAKFEVNGDLKQNGFITIELVGNATFNENEVRQWLTGETATSNDINIDMKLATVNADTTGTGSPWHSRISSFRLRSEQSF
ncbi:hypothetical protein [Salinivibrio sp. ML290]|uniref:hypothetical protein n=1 Tax=Salinivibrio sp. ML290 TaxID=1909468 RepID=UPI00098870E8|nr:hypothetical protein [Salinivibrio sp. ML290]OOE73694.1 hypothetical protein BZG23_11385 [Salinivibrio sp. ML290]